MKFVRNWFLPIVFTVLGLLVGLIIIGLPGVEDIYFVDGARVSYEVWSDSILLRAPDAKVPSHRLSLYGFLMLGDSMTAILMISIITGGCGLLLGRMFRARKQ